MNRTVVLAALAALSLTAPARAETPRATAAIAVDDPAMRLVVIASALRFQFAGSADEALGQLSAPERAVLTSALGPSANAGRWAALIGDATQFVRVDADTAETVWWNPLADAGLAVRWTRGPDRWRVTAAAPFLGATLRGAAAASGPDLATSLRATSLATRQAVSSGRAAAILDQPSSAAPVIARSRSLDQSFITPGEAASPEVDRLVAGEGLLIRTALPTGGEAGALGRFLAAMPGEARLMLAPLQRIEDSQGEAIVWGSAGLPNTLIVLRYPADAPAAVTPAQVDVVNLIVAQGDQP